MNNRTLKLFEIIHVCVLLLFIMFLFLAVPTADDYAFVRMNNAHGFVDTITNFLAGWGARYSVPIVNYLWYSSFNGMALPYSIGLIINFLAMGFAVWCIVKLFIGELLPVKSVLLVTIIVVAGIIRGLPTLDESIYWQSTGLSYILATSAMLIYIYLLSVLPKIRFKNIVLLLCLILIVFSSGMVENFIVANIIVSLCFILITASQSRCLIRYYLLLITACCCVLPVLVTSGNSSRMNCYPESGKIVASLLNGAVFGTGVIFQSISDPYIWGSVLLFIPLFKKLYDYRRFDSIGLRNKLIIVVAILLNLYAIPAIHYYGTGNRPVQRFMCVWYIIFFLSVFGLSVLFAPNIDIVSRIIKGKFSKIVGGKVSAQKFLLIISLVSFVLINNPAKAVYDLTFNIPTYLTDVRDMHNSISVQQRDPDNDGVLRLKKFKSDPILLKIPLTADYGFSKYYGFKSMKIDDYEDTE